MTVFLRKRKLNLLSVRKNIHVEFSDLRIDSSTDHHPDRYSNLFLNAYIDRHVHAEYIVLKNDTTKSTYTFTSVNVEVVFFPNHFKGSLSEHHRRDSK